MYATKPYEFIGFGPDPSLPGLGSQVAIVLSSPDRSALPLSDCVTALGSAVVLYVLPSRMRHLALHTAIQNSMFKPCLFLANNSEL
jgi:hypothetical protein